MSKKFFDVFPTLKLDTGIGDLFEQVMVEKVSATKRKDFLRIYISSERLIQKEDVFRVEREIKKQFFPNTLFHSIRLYSINHYSFLSQSFSESYPPSTSMLLPSGSSLVVKLDSSPNAVPFSLVAKALI